MAIGRALFTETLHVFEKQSHLMKSSVELGLSFSYNNIYDIFIATLSVSNR